MQYFFKLSSRKGTTMVEIAITSNQQVARDAEVVFAESFTAAAARFISSSWNDEGAAVAALRANYIRCKRGTEKELANLLAWWALLTKSDRGILASDQQELINKAWGHFYRRELGLLRWVYQ